MHTGNDIGLIGLGVMGQNLALNIAHQGYTVSVYNRTPEKTTDFIENRVENEQIEGLYDLPAFVESLEKPRRIILMVQAGKAVDLVIESILPYIDEDDLIIDAGNSYYPDTERRLAQLEEQGYLFLGMGVSGGEYGALHGPSIMPGGAEYAYELVEDILIKIAAQTDDGPCCTYVGNGSAGHFVKMVHNGIEYSIMQNTSEAYDLMRSAFDMKAPMISDVFESWNKGELNSYLYEISYKVLREIDIETGKPLVDLILDQAEQKGTGKWTSQSGLDLGVPVPSLSAAVSSRVISHFKNLRVKTADLAAAYNDKVDYTQSMIDDLRDSALFAMFLSFSQGIWLMSAASDAFGYELDLAEVLRIWKGGCIIRAKMLNFLQEIIKEDQTNVNLLLNTKSIQYLESKLDAVNRTLEIARMSRIPMPVLSSALDYYFSASASNLPANFIQAQRDFFGAHTYQRIDKKGVFHTEWEE